MSNAKEGWIQVFPGYVSIGKEGKFQFNLKLSREQLLALAEDCLVRVRRDDANRAR